MKKQNQYLFIIFPIIVFIVIRFILGFNGLYGQDSYEYLRYSNWLKSSFFYEIEPTTFFWPVMYPLLGALISFITGSTDIVLQLISFVSYIISLFLIRQILLLFYPDSKKTIYYFVLFTIMLSPFFLRSAMFVMSDACATMFCISAIYFIFMFRRTLKPMHLWLACFFTVLAFFSRYPTIIILIFPWMLICKKIFIPFQVKTILTSFVIVVAISFILLYIKNDNTRGLITHQWLQEWSLSNSFSSSFTMIEGTENYRMINILYAFLSFFHPGYFFIGLFLLPFVKKKDFANSEIIVLIISVVIYSFFLMGIPFQNIRFILISFPLFSILLFPAFTRMVMLKNWKKTIGISIFTLFTILQLSLFIYSFRPFYFQNKLEQEIANDILSNYSSTKEIYTFSIDPALKAYNIKNPISCLWKKTYTDFNTGSLVLFNPDAFSKKWKGLNPMINWEKIQNDEKIILLHEYENGWRLYEIQ